MPPNIIIIINRSSEKRPQAWKAGTESFETGLPIIGQQVLNHYVAWSKDESKSAVLHSCYDCPTRYLPAPAIDNSFLGNSAGEKSDIHRAFEFTKAIVNDIESANQAGLRPTVVSVGLDGWACDLRMLKPWLQQNGLHFDLVLRLNGLYYGMSEKFVEEDHNVYWVRHDIGDIQKTCSLEPTAWNGHDEKSRELITVWKTLQDGKDLSFGVKTGRNAVNLTASLPSVI
ncbi:hypothetical protein L13192_02062 [Pyrenophora tritici-repentis]|uniref:Uncharacterized protein n=2 Tax=Pyrenophora tritici-repentis TaxID=45151 RepID=A0A922NQR8_9PLEO|nr:uncharacterized protein PTRG_00429 [Pyrenophora tritici-repentis Pt-1C-BFP]EDU39867.1 predicted protein [Pyrenophora tritici-repentis Pt-1C-BFP]KAI1520313.1 hypothetical protein Ptr86124_000681 [Pyrenophora tritici-repentis]KAI1675315.1 hypothetical protein L13192_02062 [Pyrenophora tritici-repentis]KAI1687532.1 hypothetical protein KJE20_00709 [Pyrenophora tritici-repentis]